jgi:hypothetical protein
MKILNNYGHRRIQLVHERKGVLGMGEGYGHSSQDKFPGLAVAAPGNFLAMQN